MKSFNVVAAIVMFFFAVPLFADVVIHVQSNYDTEYSTFWNFYLFDEPDNLEKVTNENNNKFPATLHDANSGEIFYPHSDGFNIVSVDDSTGRYSLSFDPSAFVINSIAIVPMFRSISDISIDYRIGNGELQHLAGGDSWDVAQRFEYYEYIFDANGLFDISVSELQISFTPVTADSPYDDNDDGNVFIGSIWLGGDVRSVAATPEPATLLIFGCGMIGAGICLIRRGRKKFGWRAN